MLEFLKVIRRILIGLLLLCSLPWWVFIFILSVLSWVAKGEGKLYFEGTLLFVEEIFNDLTEKQQ